MGTGKATHHEGFRPLITLNEARACDDSDPLAHFRDRFVIPDDVLYLDGNSLGPLPRATIDANRDLVERQWGDRLIRSWTEGWMDAPARIGAKIAPWIGAAADEVIVADTVSANLFKLIVAALRYDPARKVVLSEAGNFPTNLHIAEGAVGCVPGAELRVVPRDALKGAVGDDTALVLLTHVHYKTCERFDMPAWTARAHMAGALICWDLSHSVGAIAVDIADADCSVGCGYKFLNGGPGAPAFMHVAKRHQERFGNVLSGWMGHAAPFAFTDPYAPGLGMERWRTGTPSMLAMAAMESALNTIADVDIAALETKSAALFDIMAAAGDAIGLECTTPRDPAQRGSHISFRHPDAENVMSCLIARGVIGDFRTPDILRFGLTPLYLKYEDVWRAGAELVEEVRSR